MVMQNFITGEPIPRKIFEDALKEKDENMLSAIKCDLEVAKNDLESDLCLIEVMLEEIESVLGE